MLYAFLILGFVAYLPSVIIAVLRDLWLIVISDTIAYIIVLFLVIKSGIKVDIRVISILLISLIIGIILLASVGPFGAGYLWLFAVPILAAVLLKFWYSIAALVVNVIFLIFFGVLQYYRILDWNTLYSFPVELWLIVSVNFALLNVGVTLPIAVLIKKLEESLIKEAGFAEELSIERQELIKAKSNAEKANKLKSEFLAQMSHEIRTPINTIMSFISLIKEEFPKEESTDLAHESFKMIELGSMRITRTIDSILNMSELQTGSFETYFMSTNLYDDVLFPVFNEFKQYAAAKSLKLNIHKNKNDVCYTCDIYTIIQLFANLVDNAIKYTKEGSIDISFDHNKNGQYFVAISDTGIGIAEDYLVNLFEPFSQEEQGYTRRYEGTGLGLSLVKKYAEINNVSIEVESKKGKGTTFTISFGDITSA